QPLRKQPPSARQRLLRSRSVFFANVPKSPRRGVSIAASRRTLTVERATASTLAGKTRYRACDPGIEAGTPCWILWCTKDRNATPSRHRPCDRLAVSKMPETLRISGCPGSRYCREARAGSPMAGDFKQTRTGRRRTMDTLLRIGDRFENGQGTPERTINPRNGALIVEVPEASREQVSAAVDAAEGAFAAWSRTTPAERSVMLFKLADRIEAEAEAFAELESLNTGKPRHLVLADEIPSIVDCFRFFAGAARTMHAPVAGEYIAGHTSMIRRDPVGVIASIAPWNYPLMMAAWKLAPALAAGNTIVLKPSEQTPLTTLKLAQHLAEIFPEGVANIITGRGETVGNALINDPHAAMLSLTGDVATGRKVVAAAQATLKRTHLELGGKAPVIVFDDADIDAVVPTLRGAGL